MRSRNGPHHCRDVLSICRPCTAVSQPLLRDLRCVEQGPLRRPVSSPQFQASILACLHFRPPTGVAQNSIFILITPGGVALDHSPFVGSLF